MSQDQQAQDNKVRPVAVRPIFWQKEGFTLVELLLVVAIMAIMIGMGVTAFSELGKGLPMRTAAREVGDTLAAARQLAISSNKQTMFVIITDPATNSQYNTYGVLSQTYVSSSNAFVYEPAVPYQSLPVGIYFQADSLVDNIGGNTPISVRGQTTTEYRFINFMPTGETTTSGESNLIIVGKGAVPGTLLSTTVSPERLTFIVGSSTGRVRLIQFK